MRLTVQPWHCLVLFEVFSLTGWYRWWPCCFTSNQSNKKIAVSTRHFVFTAFEICEVHLSYDGHTAVSLSVYRPPHSRQNKLINAMFLEQFSDLLELYVSCDGLFVVGDLNVHFDKPSDPSTSALNVVLDNLILHQLVKTPLCVCVNVLCESVCVSVWFDVHVAVWRDGWVRTSVSVTTGDSFLH